MLFSRYSLFLNRLCYRNLAATKEAWLKNGAKILTVDDAPEFHADLQAGAFAFVPKRSASSQLQASIRAPRRAECRGHSTTPQILAKKK